MAGYLCAVDEDRLATVAHASGEPEPFTPQPRRGPWGRGSRSVMTVASPRNQHKKQPPASRRLQHFTQIPHDPQQAISRRNHNPIDEAPHRVPRCFAQLVILVRQRRRQLHRLLASDVAPPAVGDDAVWE